MALLKSPGNKKVNLDFNKEFINTFSEKIENGNIEFINQLATPFFPTQQILHQVGFQ